MIKLFENQNVSIYQVQKELGLGIYTLYRYAKGQRKISNMPSEILHSLSKYFGIDVDTLYTKMKEYEANRGV
jgi:septum formation topological specificity factor MinE